MLMSNVREDDAFQLFFFNVLFFEDQRFVMFSDFFNITKVSSFCFTIFLKFLRTCVENVSPMFLRTSVLSFILIFFNFSIKLHQSQNFGQVYHFFDTLKDLCFKCFVFEDQRFVTFPDFIQNYKRLFT